MPAKGAATKRIEAPGQEPRDVNAAHAVRDQGGRRDQPGALRDQEDAVRVEQVGRTFATKIGPLPALVGMSLRARRREVVAVVGPSGCGKTTLLELVCGLQHPDSGSVQAEPAALMPQRDLLLPWLSAIDNAGLALRARGVPREEARRAAAPWLERFGLARFERTRPAELSGGMRQRVSFLRTLLAGKPVLALDEPFAALDAITRQEMQGWLAHVLADEPRTVILVTHDVEEAVMLGDRVVVMSPRPGHSVAEIDVTPPRPRRRTDPITVELRERALAALGVQT
jgi:ABC-type nitrate/sulfonate/bicarbonate transport system ATPase subunit